MIVVADEQVARKARLLRNHGMIRRYEYELVGHNARMNDVAAAVGRAQLTSLPWWTGRP